jgi:hypothetical protein
MAARFLARQGEAKTVVVDPKLIATDTALRQSGYRIGRSVGPAGATQERRWRGPGGGNTYASLR